MKANTDYGCKSGQRCPSANYAVKFTSSVSQWLYPVRLAFTDTSTPLNVNHWSGVGGIYTTNPTKRSSSIHRASLLSTR